jgi:septum site-determining protein MinC
MPKFPLEPVGKRPEPSRLRPEVGTLVSEHTLLVQQTLRSGQSVTYPGHVVVLGDVNPGAEVKAGGDERAVVVAYRLQPTQLRIAHLISRSPDEAGEPQEPEIARIREGLIVIEPYFGFTDGKAW